MIFTFVLLSCKHNPEKMNAASYNTQLGLAYLNQGDRARAKHKLFKALRQAPNSSQVNGAMAFFMEKSGEMHAAELYHRKAMAVAPGKGGPLNNYGAFICRKGQYRQAEKFFQKAAADVRYEHPAGAYENAGFCNLLIPDYFKAKAYFAKALKYDPSRKQSLFELVKIERSQGNLKEALINLQKYHVHSFNDRALLITAAEVAHKLGNIELEEQYKNQLDKFPTIPEKKNDYTINTG